MDKNGNQLSLVDSGEQVATRASLVHGAHAQRTQTQLHLLLAGIFGPANAILSSAYCEDCDPTLSLETFPYGKWSLERVTLKRGRI